MKDRFELENQIMKLYSFVDNIEDAVEYLSDSDIDPKIIDTMSNILLGTGALLGLHAERMLDTMAQCFKLDKYHNSIRNNEQTTCDMKSNIEKFCKNWDTSSMNAIHDMPYDPNS